MDDNMVRFSMKVLLWNLKIGTVLFVIALFLVQILGSFGIDLRAQARQNPVQIDTPVVQVQGIEATLH